MQWNDSYQENIVFPARAGMKRFRDFETRLDESLDYRPAVLAERLEGPSLAELEQFTLDVHRHRVPSRPRLTPRELDTRPMNAPDTLEVRLYGRCKGWFTRSSRNRLTFNYDRDYPEDAPPLSTALPVRSSPYPPQQTEPWFEGLLPEGERRRQLARIAGTNAIHTFALLLAAGEECARTGRTMRSSSPAPPGTARARLAPAYDMLSTEAHEGLDRTLATSIGRAATLDDMDERAVETLGEWTGFAPGEASARARAVAEGMQSAIAACDAAGVAPGPVPTDRIHARIARTRQWQGATASSTQVGTRTESGNSGPERLTHGCGTVAPPETEACPTGTSTRQADEIESIEALEASVERRETMLARERFFPPPPHCGIVVRVFLHQRG